MTTPAPIGRKNPSSTTTTNPPARLAATVDIPITGGAGGILTGRKVAVLAGGYHVPRILHGTMALLLAGWLQAKVAIGAPWRETALITPPLLPQQ